MSNLNSSGSNERFTLAPGEDKTFANIDTGSNHVEAEVKGDDQATGSVTVKLQTSEDNVSFSDVASAVVVPRGSLRLGGDVGKYSRIKSTSGSDIAHVVAHLRNRADVVPAL